MYIHTTQQHVCAFDLKAPTGLTVFPGDYKTGPLKLNTSWLHSLFLIFHIFLFRLIFTSFSFFIENLFSQYILYSTFPTECLYEQIISLVFLFICDLLLKSKSSWVFFKSVGKFLFINKSTLWKLYIDFAMLASSEG